MKPIVLQASAEAELNLKLTHILRVFSRADSILAARPIACALQHGSAPAPSWTDGSTITFGADEIPSIHDVNGLVVLNGLNYHELAHVLYTPGQSSDIVKRIKANATPADWKVSDGELWKAFNILEDQRIEGLLIANYPSVAPYLVATVANYFVNDSAGDPSVAWPVVYGRKYLPKNMRDHLRALFVQSRESFPIDKMEALVDEYKTFRYWDTMTHDKQRAFTVVVEYARLLKNIYNPEKGNPFSHGQCAHGSPGSEAEGTPGEVEDAEEQMSAEGQGDGKSAGNGSDGDSDGDSDAEGDSDTEGDSDDEDGDDKPGKGIGTTGDHIDVTREVAAQVLNDIASMGVVREELKRQRAIVRNHRGQYNGGLPRSGGNRVQVSPSSLLQAKKFATELQRIVADSDPGFDRHRDSGRLNVQRVIRGDDFDTVFDQWNEGNQEAASIETVVLVDISGSMGSNLRKALEAGWVVKRAHDMLGSSARCSVFSFGTYCRMVYSPTESANPNSFVVPQSLGGTVPHAALKSARDIFAISDRAHKVLITVSDGGWSQTSNAYGYGGNEVTCDQMMKEMGDAGVYTSALYITNEGQVTAAATVPSTLASLSAQYGHYAKLFVPSDGTSEIVPMGKRMVKSVMRGQR